MSPDPTDEYVNPRWNRRLALISAGVSLVVPLVALTLTGEEWSAIDGVFVIAGLGLAVLVYSRYRRISVSVSEHSLQVRNAWRTHTVSKSSVERIEAWGLYGVACPALHVRRGNRVRKVIVMAMPAPDVVFLNIPEGG